ncbi:MAG TPA: 50S ribosomal protein L23 [Acidobacteriota bacterium]|jgi:large subunit ribosomal protein L23|nr:50S ribosomal protein L23 [Acidobacteriota bacterium]
MSVYDIIRSPHLTEKSTLLSEGGDRQVVAFRVRINASKHQVKEAVEKIFDVQVDSIRTARFQGKMKRQGRNQGRRPGWKKAYVTLKPGQKIEFFEGV